MHLFSSKFKFIYTKLKLKTCHTKCLSFKMISVRWRPSSCMKFSSLFKNRPWHESTTDDRSDEFPGGWLPSNHSTYGACERKHVISNTTKEKKITRWKIGRARGPRHVSETGNEVPGETCFEQWSMTRLQCALWHHLVETTHWHSLFFFGASPPLAYLLSTTHSKDVRFPWVTLSCTIKIVYCQGDMFRPLLGHLQTLWKNGSKSYLYFNALWDPKCSQIVLQECKIHKFVYIEICVTVLELKG